MKNQKQKQQGDVNVATVDQLPEGLKRVKPKGKKYIISQGSVEGNRHVIKVLAGLTFYEGPDNMKVVVHKSKSKVELLHEGPSADHQPFELNKGINVFTPVYEINHLTKMTSPVID